MDFHDFPSSRSHALSCHARACMPILGALRHGTYYRWATHPDRRRRSAVLLFRGRAACRESSGAACLPIVFREYHIYRDQYTMQKNNQERCAFGRFFQACCEAVGGGSPFSFAFPPSERGHQIAECGSRAASAARRKSSDLLRIAFCTLGCFRYVVEKLSS